MLAEPASFPEVVARLFDAEADTVAGTGADARHQDLLEVSVGGVQVQLRRTAPFTATEHARAASMADLVSDVLQRTHAPGDRPGLPARRLARAQGAAAIACSTRSDNRAVLGDGARRRAAGTDPDERRRAHGAGARPRPHAAQVIVEGAS